MWDVDWRMVMTWLFVRCTVNNFRWFHEYNGIQFVIALSRLYFVIVKNAFIISPNLIWHDELWVNNFSPFQPLFRLFHPFLTPNFVNLYPGNQLPSKNEPQILRLLWRTAVRIAKNAAMQPVLVFEAGPRPSCKSSPLYFPPWAACFLFCHLQLWLAVLTFYWVPQMNSSQS